MDAEMIIAIGRTAPAFPMDHKTEDNALIGCSVASWVTIRGGEIFVLSNSAYVQGLLAIAAYRPELVGKIERIASANRRLGIMAAVGRIDYLRCCTGGR